jgi:hypothetical protein
MEAQPNGRFLQKQLMPGFAERREPAQLLAGVSTHSARRACMHPVTASCSPSIRIISSFHFLKG